MDDYIEKEQVSFKELVYNAKKYLAEIRRKWLLVCLISLPFILFFTYKHLSFKSKYSAELTFMVNSGDGVGTSAVAGILGQFGIGGGGGRRANLDKILAISRSHFIVNAVFADSIFVNGKKDNIANHLIDSEGLSSDWKKMIIKKDLLLSGDYDINDYTTNRILKHLYLRVMGTKKYPTILNTDYENTTGIMKILVTQKSEELVVGFANSLYEILSTYYIESSREKSLSSYNLLKNKRDSIEGVLQSRQYALASFYDGNRNLIFKESEIKKQSLQRDVTILTTAYAESVKNTELAGFDLNLSTPYINILDRPVLPLTASKSSLISNLIKGLIIGLIIGILVVVLRKLYNDAME